MGGGPIFHSGPSFARVRYIFFGVHKMAVYSVITTVWSKPTKMSEVYCLGIRNYMYVSVVGLVNIIDQDLP